MTRQTRVLVTGGAGFLGSHLCERLLDDGCEVICVDNFSTGARSNIEHLFKRRGFELIRHDVAFPLYVEVDQIYNLACPASPQAYQRDPVATVKTCVHGSINMLGLAKRNRAKILQASTSEVYGDPAVHPQVESYWGHVNPIGPRACYDEAKRAAETLFTAYRAQHHVTTKIARIFNTYGPRMAIDDGRVVSNFIVRALDGRDLVVYGDGSATRSFCYVSDLVDGLVRLMAAPDDFAGPVNLGNPTEVSIVAMARLVRRRIELRHYRLSVPYDIVYSDAIVDDPKRRQPDIALAFERLNWYPAIDLETGLDLTIDYFAKTLKRT